MPVFPPATSDRQGDTSSMGDILEESEWELDSDLKFLGTSAAPTSMKGSARAETEIRSEYILICLLIILLNFTFNSGRYFINITMKAHCIEWTLALATLLLDASVVTEVIDFVKKTRELEGGVIGKILQAVKDMNSWASSEW